MENVKIDLKSRLEKFMDYAYEFHDMPGICAGVSFGCFDFSASRGYSNYVTKEKLCKQDVFHCTSLSKLFTSLGILLLIREGKTGLDDRLIEILPDLSIADKRWRSVAIKNLLTHTSGLPDVGDYGWERHDVDSRALENDIMSQEFKGLSLLADPDENRFIYSNRGYDILGLVIERLSGNSFEEYIRKNIFEPFGMENSTFFTPVRTGGVMDIGAVEKAGLVMPHGKKRDRDIIIKKIYPYTRQHEPSSTLTSTVGELTVFGKICMGEDFLKAEEKEMLWRKWVKIPGGEESIGLGWFRRSYKKGNKKYTFTGHEGADIGFRSSFWICPELDAVIVLLSNISSAPLKKLSGRLFELICES